MPAEEITTEFLVLRKSPYSDTSLVVAGICPDHGQVHFLVRGARRVGKRQFPLVDLFRVLHIRYTPGRGELHRWHSADVVADFAAVSRTMVAYQTAAWLAKFALANVVEGAPVPRAFEAVTVALRRLALSCSAGFAQYPARLHLEVLVPACVVFLDEFGALPTYDDDADAAKRCQVLLDVGSGKTTVPELPVATWDQLYAWVVDLLHRCECRVPE